MNGREPFPELLMRPVDGDDLEAITATFRRLSPRSLYYRFLTATPDPTSLVARHVDLIDDRDHRAFAVFDGEEVVAIAQWDRTRTRADEAEIAITVEDGWQHRGLGRALSRAVAGDASRHGIAMLTARVLAENHAARGLAAGQHPDDFGFEGAETRFSFALAS